MGGVTARGFPYPTGTDRVADGDNAIQALAASIDAYWAAFDPVWGACFVPGGGAGLNATWWHNNCASAGAVGGVTINANGITVPKRAYYLIAATANVTFNQNVAAVCSLIIGDGATVWTRGSAVNAAGQDRTQPRTTACSRVVILNPGTQVRWGFEAAGTSAGLSNEDAINNTLSVRLLSLA